MESIPSRRSLFHNGLFKALNIYTNGKPPPMPASKLTASLTTPPCQIAPVSGIHGAFLAAVSNSNQIRSDRCPYRQAAGRQCSCASAKAFPGLCTGQFGPVVVQPRCRSTTLWDGPGRRFQGQLVAVRYRYGALRSGRRSRRFKSCHPDHESLSL